MPAFYLVVIPLVVLVLVLGLFQGDPASNLVTFIILLGFLYFGWPIWANVTLQNDVIFRTPLRKYKIMPSTLRSVKVGAIRDSRVQIIIRVKGGLPVNYRIRKYTDAPDLAKSVLGLVRASPDAKVSVDAIRLLEGIAAKAN